MKIKLLLVFCVSALLSGCFTPLSIAQSNKNLGEKGEYYAFAINTEDLSKTADAKDSPCVNIKLFESTTTEADRLWLQKELCSNPAQWVLVHANFYGLNGRFVKTALWAPKAANIEGGDIVKFSRDTTIRYGSQFLYVAAKANERDAKKCDWVGSKILNYGGVECEGWSYKNMPVFQ